LLATLIDEHSEWSYLDDGSDLGTSWRDLDFDDHAWPIGIGKFGFGNDDDYTELRHSDWSFWPNDDGYVTAYFRQTIDLI
jgi:hypothetical protein